MRRIVALASMVFLSLIAFTTSAFEFAGKDPESHTVDAEIVATGIPGAGAIAQVGTFHKGGPFRDNPVFAAQTQPGRVLERTRLFVASTSNFGAPLARPAEAPGSILSLDVNSGLVVVPPDFAAAGGQATAAGGRVILYNAVPEVGARNFASNSTLGGGSDLYVLNRGDNTIVGMTQDGRSVAHRRIRVPGLASFRVNGLAVSEDARTIWITATAPGRQGVVLRIPTFGAGAVTTSMLNAAAAAGADGAVLQGMDMFGRDLDVEQGLGPLFNGRSCDSCHNTVAGATFAGGMGVTPASFVVRIARIEQDMFHLLPSHGPIARQQSIPSLDAPCGIPTGMPPQANATSSRSAMTLRGTSLIDNIRVGDINRVRLAQPPDVQGRFNILEDGRPGKFGWKAQTATLVDFMAEALRDEIGLTNAMSPHDLIHGCGASIVTPEADAVPLTSLVAFLNTLDPPIPGAACLTSPGAALFQAARCAECHTPSMPGPGSGAPVRLYSDLLLHDMGPDLADGFLQGSASGAEFRTMPLWRVADRSHFLHDGRATTIVDAILGHGGQAAAARAALLALTDPERQALLAFLGCI